MLSDLDRQDLDNAEDLPGAIRGLLDRPPVAHRLLDAARVCVLDRGISRVTMSDVARLADVSRTTLYRHYPDVEAVLRDLMTLDFGTIVLQARADSLALGTARERTVVTIVEGARALRASELFRKIIDVDPEHVLPYLTARAGQSQQIVRALLEAAVGEGHADGSVRPGDPSLLARLLLIQAQALTVSIGTVTAGDQAVEEELMRLAADAIDAQLRPPADG